MAVTTWQNGRLTEEEDDYYSYDYDYDDPLVMMTWPWNMCDLIMEIGRMMETAM